QGLADNAGEEAGGCAVWLARPHHNGRQANTDTLAEAAPGMVGEKKFADRLLRAIGGQRREMKLIRNGRWEGRAEHGNRGCIDELWPIAVPRGADRLEQQTHSVEVDAIALVEVHLRLPGDNTGEVKDR